MVLSAGERAGTECVAGCVVLFSCFVHALVVGREPVRTEPAEPLLGNGPNVSVGAAPAEKIVLGAGEMSVSFATYGWSVRSLSVDPRDGVGFAAAPPGLMALLLQLRIVSGRAAMAPIFAQLLE